MQNRTKSNLKNNEQGVVAILVTVIFMLLLTLIVLAFSQAARREQRQTLDNQLSRQAFYAAESGINDTLEKIKNGAPGFTTAKKTDCDTTSSNLDDASDGAIISYSCVLYDKTPPTLEYSSLDAKEGEIIPLDTTTGTLSEITISWHDANNGTEFSGCSDSSPILIGSFTKDGDANCDAGILRAMIIKKPGSSDDRDVLVNNSFTTFLRPSKNSLTPSISYQPYSSGPNSQANIVPVQCASSKCSITINNLAGDGYYLQLRSIYKDNKVSISGKAGVTPVEFDNAQIMVDVTGRANDVLRRLQIRKPLRDQYLAPQYVIEAMNGICKQLDVYPGSPATSNSCGTIQ